MSSHDFIAEMDEDLPGSCPGCGNKYAELNYFGKRPISCVVCATGVRPSSTVDWKSDLEKWAREYIAKKEKKS